MDYLRLHPASLRTAWHGLVGLLTALLLLLFVDAVQGQSLLFTNARLIIGDGSVIERGSIRVEGASIVAIGESDDLSAGASATTVDLLGKTVIPALIDGHAHLGYQGRTSWGAENYSQENLIDNLEQYAYYGFGAVFSAGSDAPGLVKTLQTRLAAGEINAARILIAAGMAPPDQGPNDQFLTHALAVEQATGTRILWGLESPQQARVVVREIAAQGTRFIKLWVDDRGGSQQKLTPALYRAVTEEANALGLRVFVHQQFAEDMPDLIAAGAHGFLHGRIGRSLDEAIAVQLKEANVFVVPNLGLGELRREAIGADVFLGQILSSDLRAGLLPGAGQRTLQPTRDATLEAEQQGSFRALIAAGVDVVLGTDAGAVPDHPFGYSGHRELEIFVRLGMSPLQAITAATHTAALHLQLNDMGLLQPGYSADFVILDENPLQDIRNTRRISAVYLQGRPIDRAALQTKWVGR